MRGKVGVGGESCRDDDRQARTSPNDGGECVGLLHSPEGGECVGLPHSPEGGEWCSLAQLVTATDRRVLLLLTAESASDCHNR